MNKIEVDKETLNQIAIYNGLTKKWNDGVVWLSDKNLTEEQFEKGMDRLQLRLKQLNDCYNFLILKGIDVVPEVYIDSNKYILEPPF